MDEETRGNIEHTIDDELELSVLNEDTKWVFDTIPISSEKDFLLGFIVGKLMTAAWTTLIESQGRCNKSRPTRSSGNHKAKTSRNSGQNCNRTKQITLACIILNINKRNCGDKL